MLLFTRGKDSVTEEAFRKDYGRLAELRSLLHRHVPFIALTATATEATRKLIMKDLCMKDCVQILGDPNKTNIRYTVNDIDHENLYETFKPIIDEVEEKHVNTTKIMVFCRRKEHVKDLFELFTQCLGPKAYYRPTGKEPMDDRSRLFAMYHKKTHSLVKKTIETEFCLENGTVRVVFCTIAFGMGVNVRGGNTVIHLGPSSGLDDYLQESGRVGRNKESAHAILLRYKGCTRSRNISKQMKEYVKNKTECRRVLLLKSFTASPVPNTVPHSCCDICSERCTCLCKCTRKEQCSCSETCKQSDHQSSLEHLLQSSATTKPTHEGDSKGGKLKGSKAKQLRDNLLQYRLQLAGNVSHEQLLTGIDLATGFTRTLVDSIVASVKEITSLGILLEKFSFFERTQAEHVWQCLCDLSDSSSDDNEDDSEITVSLSEDIDIEPSFLRRRRTYVLDRSDEDSDSE